MTRVMNASSVMSRAKRSFTILSASARSSVVIMIDRSEARAVAMYMAAPSPWPDTSPMIRPSRPSGNSM